MSSETLFRIQLVLGYVAWLLCFSVYLWPRLKAMGRFEAQRAIATLHSFRFFGLVFILPGVVGAGLPADFAAFAAYGDLVTGLLAMLALLTARIRPLVWSLVIAFNLVGVTDLVVDYYHAAESGLPARMSDHAREFKLGHAADVARWGATLLRPELLPPLGSLAGFLPVLVQLNNPISCLG